MEKESVFLNRESVQNIRDNMKKYPWAKDIGREILNWVKPYGDKTYDELWDSIFGSTLERAWHVWSNGYCPSCKADVPMYSWIMDPFKYPWKVMCPHCKELFPKNDFLKYYKSGLDEGGIFRYRLADDSLLYNTDHPLKDDPLHLYGVDDGRGYSDGINRWRFMGAYLIYGQWKKYIVSGIKNLSDAYVITGDREYARKAFVLLYRLGDVFESFDYKTQGIMYEEENTSYGFISYWCDSCFEVRELALAYDSIIGVMDDEKLNAYIDGKGKRSIVENIEVGLFGTILDNTLKIHCNYPQMDITVAIIKTVLSGLPLSRDVVNIVDKLIEGATKTDGVTGEKGLSAYSALATKALGSFLARYSRIDNFLEDIFLRHPNLKNTFRFHMDTWFLMKYYPLIGDCGSFGRPEEHYVGLTMIPEEKDLEPSMASFLVDLYRITGDGAYIQTLNHSFSENIPWDLRGGDMEGEQALFEGVIKEAGPRIALESKNFTQWKLAILSSGAEENERYLWIDYDSGGMHGHLDGMNIGFVARGLDLMPDFGYPPVQYGGWRTKEVKWYTGPYSHNTVVVDGKKDLWEGECKIWAVGDGVKVVSITNSNVITHNQYQRTLVLADISREDSYVLDVFRSGKNEIFGLQTGNEHLKFQHFTFGKAQTTGLALKEASLGDDVIMENIRVDLDPPLGWQLDFSAHDHYGVLPQKVPVNVTYTDLSRGVRAYVADSWIDAGFLNKNEPALIPTVVVGKNTTTEDPVATFISVIEPHGKTSNIESIKRLGLKYVNGDDALDCDGAIEITLKDKRQDLIITVDTEDPLYRKTGIGKGLAVIQKEWDIEFSGELCVIRRGGDGKFKSMFLCNCDFVRVGDVTHSFDKKEEWLELNF